MWIAKDEVGTRVVPDKPEWNGHYFYRQSGREFPVPSNITTGLQVGEFAQVKGFVLTGLTNGFKLVLGEEVNDG